MPVTAGLIMGGAQGVLGGYQAIDGMIKTSRLMKQRTAYRTPDEMFKILKATQSRASQGYDPFTLNYLTSQSDRAFSEAAGAAKRLGADPNNLSALLDQRLQNTFKIGAENQQLNMKNFAAFLQAMGDVGASKTAEWKSEQDIIKDKLQAASAQTKQGVENFGNGMNTTLGALAYKEQMKLGVPDPSSGVGMNFTPPKIDLSQYMFDPNAPINPADLPFGTLGG